ncbi:MAG: BrnA antitoxin family protein [Ignavibacteriales bacterium]|nr:BrnA antitoxin family protein [Ignavibacteriales bacterium]
MSKRLKTIPKFKNEDEEREFWANHDSIEYVNWKEARLHTTTSPQLHRSVKTISLRLTESMLDNLRVMANERDVPYQSLIKMILQERIKKELHS